MSTCASCRRPLGRVATRCIYCGTAVDGAPPRAGRSTTRPPLTLVACPGCLRKVRGTPDTIVHCTYCALAFGVTGDGNIELGPLGAVPVAPADVEDAVTGLPAARLWELVRDVLLARAARGELVEGETESALGGLTAVATWPSDRALWVPLSIDDAAKLVPRIVFGTIEGSAFREGDRSELLIVLGTRPRANVDRKAFNVLGFASSLALGVGFGANDGDLVDTAVRLQIRLDLVSSMGGVELAHVETQIDQSVPRPISPAQAEDLVARVATSRVMLASYYILGALFGPSCRGGTAFAITEEAIATRVQALGCHAAPDLVASLRLRPPSLFAFE